MIDPDKAASFTVDENVAHNKFTMSAEILLYLLLLSLTIFTAGVLRSPWFSRARNYIGIIHESGLAILYGMLIGLMLIALPNPEQPKTVEVRIPQASNWSSSSDIPSVVVLQVNTTILNASTTGKTDIEIAEKSLLYELVDGINCYSKFSPIVRECLFSPIFFFHVLLPPIIFNEGYSMHKKAFFRNFGAIVMFALIGTLIAAFTFAGILYLFCVHLIPEPTFSFVDLVYFGAIISATDPVTVLAIFQVRQFFIELLK